MATWDSIYCVYTVELKQSESVKSMFKVNVCSQGRKNAIVEETFFFFGLPCREYLKCINLNMCL